MMTSTNLDDATNELLGNLDNFRYYYYTPILNVTIVVSIIAIIILIAIISVYSKWGNMIWLSSFLGIVIYLLVAGLLYKGMWCSTQYDDASDNIVRRLVPDNQLTDENEVMPDDVPDDVPDAISKLGLNVHEIQHFNRRWRNFNISESKAVATDGYSIGYWFNI